MDFFDASCYIGRPPALDGSDRARRDYLPPPDVDGLLAELKKAGIGRALVWHCAQTGSSPQLGNRLLAAAIAPHANLYGCWALLPECTGELPARPALFAQMRAGRIAAVRISPGICRFLANRVTLGPLFDDLSARRIPVLVSVRKDMNWEPLAGLMAEFPDLTVVCADRGDWGDDRFFRPLVERYPCFHVELASYFLDGGIAAFVEAYGPERLLFGSGWPEAYPGAMMLALRRASIPDTALHLVAAGNLDRLLREARFD